MKMKLTTLLASLGLVLPVMSQDNLPSIPSMKQVVYQGYLLNGNGEEIDGVKEVRFKLYRSQRLDAV